MRSRDPQASEDPPPTSSHFAFSKDPSVTFLHTRAGLKDRNEAQKTDTLNSSRTESKTGNKTNLFDFPQNVRIPQKKLVQDFFTPLVVGRDFERPKTHPTSMSHYPKLNAYKDRSDLSCITITHQPISNSNAKLLNQGNVHHKKVLLKPVSLPSQFSSNISSLKRNQKKLTSREKCLQSTEKQNSNSHFPKVKRNQFPRKLSCSSHSEEASLQKQTFLPHSDKTMCVAMSPDYKVSHKSQNAKWQFLQLNQSIRNFSKYFCPIKHRKDPSRNFLLSFKNPWILTIVVLVLVIFATTIGNICYFVLFGNSAINDQENLNVTSSPTSTSMSVVPTRKGELSQIQFCGAFPAKYIYAFDEESAATSNRKKKIILHKKPEKTTKESNSISQQIKQKSQKSEYNQPLVRLPRVVGGSDAELGTVPWQASLWVKYIGMVCGGSIILKNWILTAAHCIKTMSEPLGWDAYVGMRRMSKKRVPPGKRMDVIKIISHENYTNDTTFDYDICLFQLRGELIYSEFIQPICLPHQSFIFPDGMPCYVSGWGSMKDAKGAPDPDFLQIAKINIINNDTCKLWNKGWVTDRMICAGEPQGGKDACEGDSGGPLSCYIPEFGMWMIAGSVSWGEGCALSHHPGVYVKISYFTKWIWTKIGKVEGWIPKAADFPYPSYDSYKDNWMLNINETKMP